jgi:hypothetical protein
MYIKIKGFSMNCLTELHKMLKIAENCMSDISHNTSMRHHPIVTDLEMNIAHCLTLIEELNKQSKDLQCKNHIQN